VKRLLLVAFAMGMTACGSTQLTRQTAKR